jgi:hypothetical protein
MKTIFAKQPETPSSGSAHRSSRKPVFSDHMFPSSDIAMLLRDQKVQRAVKIGNPNDKYEQEADQVADKVIKGKSSGLISRIENNGAASSSISQDHKTYHHLQHQAEEEEEEAQTKQLQRQPVEKEEEEALQPKLVQRQEEEEEEMMQPKLIQRQEEEEEEEELQLLQADGKSGSSGNATLAAKAIDTAGSGNAMTPSTRSTLESGMGNDFGNVKVHEDETARQAARSLDARAFTHKNDIWLGQGESQNDVRLMAHEATHVVQQTGSVQRLIQKNDTPLPSPTAVPATTPDQSVEAQIDPAELPLETGRVDTANNKITFSEILIPLFKMQAHRGSAYRSHTLKRQKNYTRGNPNQRDKWRREVSTTRIRSVLENKTKRSQNITEIDPGGTYVFEVPVRGNAPTPFIFGSLDDVAVQMTTPMWARQSRNPPLNFYDVDHIVELQLANWSNDSWANNLDNMELLDSAINQDSGRKLRANIIRKVNDFLRVTGDRFGTSVADIKQRYDLEFQTPVPGGGGAGNVGRNDYWTREDIEQARHMNSVHSRGLEVLGEEGTARVFSTATGGLGKSFSINGPLNSRESNWLKPFKIAEKSFNTEGDNIEETSEFGHFMVHVPRDDPDWQGAPYERVTIDRVPGAQYAGRINKASVRTQFRNLRKKGASPIRMDTFDIRPDTGVTATGAILPDISFLRGGLNFIFDNGSLRIYKAFTGNEIEVPDPFCIRSSSLIVSYDTEGFGGSGRVDFGIDNVGEGFVEVSVSTGGGLGLGGGFDFDSNLFDPARIEISYIDGVFRGSGEIGIPRGRVTGINAATFTAAIEGNSISAFGTVNPTLEAIEEGIVNLSYSPEEGVSIGGGLQLSNSIPNIDSGQIDVEISKPPDAETWDLSATGELQASLAGLTATVNVDYNNGLFTIEGNGEYNRGMMSGTLQVGATNRRVDDQGNITDELGSQIIAYGGGNVRIRITPWLEGTAGIRLLPNGEIELSGEIALPDSLDIFPEQRMDRNLFSINLDIPILGFAVAGQRIGVFATIGGGLDLSAGVGPGQLTELGLGITYNPDHEDQTRITGGARLVIPAEAGLRLFIRGALGVGIPIVSASLGLEIGGELGLEGAVEAGVQVEWSPSQGLSLDATGEIWVQPKFRFDITGFLEVEADLFVTSIDLYSKRWELAAFEFGPDLRFGLRLPIHYQENEAFDISWDDVEFEVPDIDTDEIISGLIDRVV